MSPKVWFRGHAGAVTIRPSRSLVHGPLNNSGSAMHIMVPVNSRLHPLVVSKLKCTL